MTHPTGPQTSSPPVAAESVDLAVRLGRLSLPNPILVGSGTFGYAREMAGIVDLARLGGIVPKTITRLPRAGNKPRRTVETTGGMLNSIGLDNDGIETFLEHHWPYLSQLASPVIVSVAGRDYDDFVHLASRLAEGTAGSKRPPAAIELNISCPNVSHGVDFGTDPAMCKKVVAGVRAVVPFAVLAKLTPNVADPRPVAQAAADGGADAVVLINTLLGMAIDWRRRKPLLGNVVGGLSGPAIKPVALRIVHQVARAVSIPIIGVGGAANLDDVMEFLVAGATAVQIGTANFYDPTVTIKILDQLPAAIASLGGKKVSDVVRSLQLPH